MKKSINEISELTCGDSLAYCCPLMKFCAIRDKVIKELGLEPHEFTRLKEEFDKNLRNLLEK